MSVLVAYGSKRGGTAGLAGMVGDAFQCNGIGAHTVDARTKVDLADYEAVVIGGSLYASRWNRTARRFVKRNASALSNLDVWFFSSGPLDDSAVDGHIPPVAQVERLMARVDAKAHETFGGRLEPDAKGFPASGMAKTKAGDWRDEDHVSRWVDEIAAELRSKSVD